MKKGFTLVEIIISISIILIVGVSTTFFVLNNKSNKNLESITKEVLEAAKLYVNKEVDKNGNNYVSEVMNDKKGVKIPLSNLVEKGYIEESVVTSISNKLEYDIPENEDYFVMFIEGTGEEENYCDDGSSYLVASWTMVQGSPVYLCDSSNIASGSNSCPTFIDELRGFYYDELNNEVKCGNKNPIITELNEVDDSDYYSVYNDNRGHFSSWGGGATHSDVIFMYITSKTNGLHVRKIEYDDNLYYYRGNVNDNYVRIIDYNGALDECEYRILSFNSYSINLISDGYACSYGTVSMEPLRSPTLEEVKFAGCYEVDEIFIPVQNNNDGRHFSYNIADTWITDGGSINLSNSTKVVFNGTLCEGENCYNSSWGVSYLSGVIGSVPSFQTEAYYDNRFIYCVGSYPPDSYITMDMVSGNGNQDNPYIIDFSKQNN